VNWFTPDRIAFALSWAERYEAHGWRCLPSRCDDKRPLLPAYAHLWEGPFPSVRELWGRYPSGNIQLMPGREAGLAVVDVDGEEAIRAWNRLFDERGASIPRTWISSRDEKAGRHYWFRLPRPLRRGPYLPKRLLWGVWEPEANGGRGAWRKRAGIELLADRSLVMAPPSIHPKTGQTYRWHRGNDPHCLPYGPATLPSWVAELDAAEDCRPRDITHCVISDRPEPKLIKIDGEVMLPAAPSVIRGMLPKLQIVEREWGVRIADYRTNHKGWMRARKIGVEDRDPSAMFNPVTGRFWQPDGFPPTVGEGRSICLFGLGVWLGHYATWKECAFDLARRYLPELFKDRS
jgi:hypothetical protein